MLHTPSSEITGAGYEFSASTNAEIEPLDIGLWAWHWHILCGFAIAGYEKTSFGLSKRETADRQFAHLSTSGKRRWNLND